MLTRLQKTRNSPGINLLGMRACMPGQAARGGETSPTIHTLVRLFPGVGPLMLVMVPFCEKRCPHKSHWYGFFPKWVLSCAVMLPLKASARKAAHTNHIGTAFPQCGSSHAWSWRSYVRNAAHINRIGTAFPQSVFSHAWSWCPYARTLPA